MIIGTAGHIDHGKSALVERLTGIDPDRWDEEKRRGMTIDLGFAQCTLPGVGAVAMVDVPGHERFVRNMVAGATGIDVALLVVAADDGVMPYIGMGEPGRPVTVWYWQAGQGAEHLEAHGFGSLEKSPGAAPEHDARHDSDGWRVVLRGPLADAPLPVALAVWDGAVNQRNGDKHLSAWHLVHVPGAPVDGERYGALLAQQEADGDPEQGRSLFMARGCIGCHRVPDGPDVDVGPDLRLAGALHWPGYLRRMIEDPSAFIVPGKGYGIPAADGTMQSLMPRQELDAEEIKHIIAWLAGHTGKGLGGE